MDDRSVPGIDTYASRLIRFKSRELSRQPGFSHSDRCDLEQILLTDLIVRLPKFNPAKAQLNTFVARVVERKIASIIRHRTAEMRSPEREECSLDDTVLDCDGRSVARHQTIPECSSVPQRLRELERDVADVLARLPDLHRSIALGLVTGTINSVATELGIPRSAVERHIEELKAIFEDAGLREYL
jgi:RNA polymerase sigma-70 factor (ECF subfamily)